MGRPIGTKNNMRTIEEKEKIVLEYLNGKSGFKSVSTSHDIDASVLKRWVKKYREEGIEGLKSNSGHKTGGAKGRPIKASSKEEELERIIIKQQVEIERLKKGYYVKGAGQKKEYISTCKRNTK